MGVRGARADPPASPRSARAAPKPAPQFGEDAANRPLPRALADYGWMLWLVVRAMPGISTLWAVETLLQALLVPAQLWLTKALVDALAAQLQGSGGQQAPLWLGLLIVVLLAGRVLGGLEPWLIQTAKEASVSALQARVMRHAAGLDLPTFEHQGYYDQLDRVLTGAEVRWAPVLGQFLGLVRTLIGLASYALALASLTPVLLVVSVAGMAPGLWLFFGGGVTYYRLLNQQTQESRLGDYYAGLLAERTFAKEVRLYGLAGYALQRWTSLYWQTRDERRALALRQAIKQRGAILAGDVVAMAGLVWVVAAGLSQATPGGYALLFQSLIGLIQSLFSLANGCKVVGEQVGYAGTVRAFFQLPSETAGTDGTAHTSMAGQPGEHAVSAEGRTFPRPLRQGVRFEDVWFTYPGSERPALAGVTCEIGAGETVALVGENGAGKTTLVKLLIGLYRPDAGRITFDGIDATEIDPAAHRAAASAVLQQFVHYHLTLRENVGLGQPERLDSVPGAGAPNAAIAAAVMRAGAENLVRSLPATYETLLGPDVGGVDLSGGQWQRVALARAFYRDAEVLVLDEPTAALDPLAELAIFERFADLAQGRTTILISHRLGMARLADRVLVLQHGRIVEHGAHETLVGANGEYAALFAAQARWYA